MSEQYPCPKCGTKVESLFDHSCLPTAMSEPTDYHRKLAEAIATYRWPKGVTKQVDAIAAALASEGVVDPHERRRRVYYQNIVYSVCDTLDALSGGTIVCGTVKEPTGEVQQATKQLADKAERLTERLAEAADTRRTQIHELKRSRANVERLETALAKAVAKPKCVMGEDGICSCGYNAKAHVGMYP